MSVEIAYVSMVESLDATGESLFQAMKTVLEEVGLDLAQCFGFASDGASTMMEGGGEGEVLCGRECKQLHQTAQN